jgi:hypothetical protein
MKGKKMKKLFTALMLVMFVSSLSFAQANKNWDGTKPEVYKGSKNFIFMYSPFVSTEFGGAYAGSYSRYVDSNTTDVRNQYGVGFQYFVSNEISLSLGFHFGTGSWTPTWAGATAKSSNTLIGFALDGNYHFKALYGISPYLGLGINYGTESSTTDYTYGLVTGQRKTSGNSFSIGANFGFDWYFTPGLSIGGKYVLGYQSNSAPTVTNTSSSTSAATTYTGPSTSGFGTGRASIMLNVHF